MGVVFFLFLGPLIAAMIAIVIGLIIFMGMCLLVIGCTGTAMNKIYMKQIQTDTGVSKPLFNVSSIILGIILMLFPLGCVLYMFFI